MGRKHSKRPFLTPSPSPNLRPPPQKPDLHLDLKPFSATLKRVRNYLLQNKSRFTPAIPLHGSYKAKSAVETGIEEASGGKGKAKGEEVILKATMKRARVDEECGGCD